MPAIGWAAGHAVQKYIASFDHWLAFGLLALVGSKMILGARSDGHGERRSLNDPTSGWDLVMLSIATSIDALAVGLSLALIGSGIVLPALVIGLVAAAFTSAGMLLGRQIGTRWGKRVEILGGLILFAIGIKIVLEHTLT
jgi:putative Mn2+ efflux pump MntP